MNYRNLILCSSIAFWICCFHVEGSDSTPNREDSSFLSENGNQGVRGKISQYYSIGTLAAGEIKAERKEVPASVIIYIYKGKVKDKSSKDSLVGKTKSANDGIYKVALEPGEYTLAVGIDAESKNRFFNEKWETVTITADQWAEHDIKNTNTGK